MKNFLFKNNMCDRIGLNNGYQVLLLKANAPIIISKSRHKNYFWCFVLSLLAGIVNGLFGGGSGLLIVLLLNKVFNLDIKTSHASAIFIVLPLCIISIFLYIFTGHFDFNNGYWTVIGVVIGGYIGAKIIKKMSTKHIKLLFSLVVLVCAIKLMVDYSII